MSPTKVPAQEIVYKKIINPKAQQKLEWDIHPLVERPETLEEKTVYIINQRWGGTRAHELLLLELKKWFEDHFRGINVLYKVKLGSYAINDTALWEEVGQQADAAIIGIPH
jgi:hypothetical protein